MSDDYILSLAANGSIRSGFNTEAVALSQSAAIEIQTREIRDGQAMLMQGRSVTHNLDGTKECGDWETHATITNYGEIYDEKPSFFNRVIALMGWE